MTATTPSFTPPTDPQRSTNDDSQTKVQQGGESAPRLPHERDQSSDSQQTRDEAPTEVGKQGAADVARGLVDTDRGPVTDRVYKAQVRR